MRRVAVFAVAAVALALLGLPPVLGMLTESQVTARVAALDESGVLKASLRSYERGWFRSHARIAVGLAPRLIAKLDALGAAGGMPSFAASLDRNAPVEIEIAHGPLAVLDGVHFGWSKIVARFDPRSSAVVALDQSLGVPYLFEFRGRRYGDEDVKRLLKKVERELDEDINWLRAQDRNVFGVHSRMAQELDHEMRP